MDRARLVELVALAEHRIAQGERHIAMQRGVIAVFQRQGLEVNEAIDVLMRLEQLQAAHVFRRNRLRKELGPRVREARG